MKESWLFYNYLRRWWWLLVLGIVTGGTAGLLYYNSQDREFEYTAKATVAIQDTRSLYEIPLVVHISVETGQQATANEAIDSAGSTIREIGNYTGTPVTIRDLVVDRTVDTSGWWKAVVLGAVFGILMAIGAAYVWEDLHLYYRRQLENQE